MYHLCLCLGVEVDGPVDGAEVQLKDCQGSALKVSGVKVASLVVEDVDGSQAELETQVVVSDSVKSCILSLGQLYRAGWSVQQDNMGPMLESPDKTLRVPVLYQRNSLAIRGEVCGHVADDDCSSDVGIVRAVVGLEEKFKPNVLWMETLSCVALEKISSIPVWLPCKFQVQNHRHTEEINIRRGSWMVCC